jgi:hypothetical protein
MELNRIIFWLTALTLLLFFGMRSSLKNMSKTGGWKKLAGVYQTQSPFAGPRLLFRYLRCGGREYAACLTVGYAPNGLSLSMTLPIFRFGHPRLFVPWEDIQSVPAEYLFLDRAELSFKRVPGVTIQISRRTALLLKERTDTKGAFNGIY